MSVSSESECENSDTDELILVTKNDIEGVTSLLHSISVLHESVSKKLKQDIKDFARITDDAEFVKQFRASSTSIEHIIKVTSSKVRKISKKIDRFQNIIDEKDSEIEKIEENHAFALNDLERSCKIHKEDKKLLLPLSFKTVQYTDEMSKNVGGDTKCSTCLEDFTTKTLLAELSCGHFFHKDCAIKWMSESKSECSLCKTHVTGKISPWKKRKLPFLLTEFLSDENLAGYPFITTIIDQESISQKEKEDDEKKDIEIQS